MRALLLLLMLPALASAQIYRWTDERGQVHYSEKPQAPSAEQEQQCSQLRKRLTQLEEGGRFYRRGADGSTEYVSDAEVVATRDRLRGEVAAACP